MGTRIQKRVSNCPEIVGWTVSGLESLSALWRALTVTSARFDNGMGVVMNTPFDDENGSFFVLVNDENQHSLWPTFADVPTGWQVAFGESDRQSCLDYVEKNWTDMRP